MKLFGCCRPPHKPEEELPLCSPQDRPDLNRPNPKPLPGRCLPLKNFAAEYPMCALMMICGAISVTVNTIFYCAYLHGRS